MISFGLMESWFYYVRDQKLTFPCFLDFWTPGNPYIWILFYEITSKSISKYMDTFEKYYFCIYGLPFLSFNEQDGHRRMMKIRLIKFPKSWIWDQYLSKGMNGILLTWYQYLLRNTKWLFWNLRWCNLDKSWKSENSKKVKFGKSQTLKTQVNPTESKYVWKSM